MIISHGYEGRNAGTRNGRTAKVALILIAMVVALGACAALALYDWSGFTGSSGRSLASLQTSGTKETPPPVLPVSAPEALRNVSREEAEKINAAMPVSTAPNPAAASLYIPIGDGKSFLHALDCMTSAIYYEAASESDDGLRAVAQVVLNRTRHPAFPDTICGVVFEGSERKTGCQFSFTCDGSLARIPSAAGWARARRIANEALAGRVFAPVGWSTHYHTDWVAPYWAPTLTKTAIIGAHIFYRWPEGWGKPAAFKQKYAGIEPDIQQPLLQNTDQQAEALAATDAALPPMERTVLPINGKLPSGAVPLVDMAGAGAGNKTQATGPTVAASTPPSTGASRWVIPASAAPRAAASGTSATPARTSSESTPPKS